ncbi:MAG: GNAT family N-acetyltransferase [Nocardioidaceae bacterium]
MRSELTLRPATPEDAEVLASLATAARHAAVPHMPPPVHTADEDRAWIARQLAGEREAWVAEDPEDTDRLVGYVLLEPRFLHSLYVAPDRLRQGIGTALLDLVKALRPDGFALWVFESNRRARAFYARHGLRELEHTDGATNEEGAPDLRMAWPGTDPLAYLRAEAEAVDAELAGLRARRAALAEALRDNEAGE